MKSAAAASAVSPPWGHPEFLTEDGLRAAQEYYFQTHATHARMIAQGRAAQGLSKSFLRRKLAREMGEDFKMYTGTNIGQSSAPEDMASLGIRGELNALLKHVYTRIAPNHPISSPIQEDLTILKDAHGAQEVIYAMVFYYNSLLRQYASFAANRRKVLKSVMDEELFKWVWRMVIGFMMQPEEKKLSLEPSHLSAGLGFIPSEQQRLPLGGKLYEIGMFLLSKHMEESHLRLPLCYFYVVYLRQLQTLLALHTSRQELDAVYTELTRRIEGEPVEHPLVAIDALLNGKGTSMDAFDDVLKDGERLGEFISDEEFAFINQFEDFGNQKRLAATLRRLIPDVRRDAVEGHEPSLMPLMLTLRVMPGGLREAVLGALPLPLLNLVRNRINNTSQDDVARGLLEELHASMDRRKGETYTVAGATAVGKVAVASSVRPGAPAGGASASGAPAPAAQAAPAQPAAQAAQAAPRPAEPPKPAGPNPAVQAALAAAARPAPAAQKTGGVALETPAVLAWRLEGARVATISLSARELMALAGAEARCLVPWVVFALRTGQVFGLSAEQVNKERVGQLVQALRRHAVDQPARIAPEQLAALLDQVQGGSHAKLLLALVKAAGLQRFMRVPDVLAPALDSLGSKFGEGLKDFLRKPGDAAFAEQRASLTADEKHALAVLQRVARNQ